MPQSGAFLTIFGVAVFLGAFLLFLVQLLLGKLVLPIFGGAPSVWTACMMFFQLMLLAGYSLAHVLASRFSAEKQAWVVLSVLGLSLCLLVITWRFWPTPITPTRDWNVNFGARPVLSIVRFLSVAIGLPFLILTTTSPLLQNWFSAVRGGIPPYRLYALSNAGSLLGLLTYPFLLEPLVRLRTQAWIWTWGYAAFLACFAACACQVRTAAVAGAERPPQNTDSRSGNSSEASRIDERPALWIALAFSGSILLLATTNFICQEVAVIPFLWVLPLSVYLLSFVLTFESSGWYLRGLFHMLFAVAVVAVVVTTRARSEYSNLAQIGACVALLFVGCMICHGEVAKLRPAASRLTKFYLCISGGGALGGLFVSLVAPRIFLGYWEFPLGILACAALLLRTAYIDRNSWLRNGQNWVGAALLAAAVPVAAVLWKEIWPAAAWLDGIAPMVAMGSLAALAVALYFRFSKPTPRTGKSLFPQAAAGTAFLLLTGALALPLRSYRSQVVSATRNFYGTLAVVHVLPEDYMVLQHGKTAHGFQFQRPDLARIPTGYYGQHSGANILLRNFRRSPVRLGIIGMGAGTLAALGKPGDIYRFYEINPDVPKYSAGDNPVFTFIRDSRAQVETIMGDGRLSLETELGDGRKENFDVLIVDAFSSDAIPMHLLTREAFAIYLRHLRSDDSVIAVHITNRTLDLGPVLAGIAQEFGLSAIRVHPTWLGGVSGISDWILLSRTTNELSDPEILRASVPFPGDRKPMMWTDDYSNLLRMLK